MIAVNKTEDNTLDLPYMVQNRVVKHGIQSNEGYKEAEVMLKEWT